MRTLFLISLIFLSSCSYKLHPISQRHHSNENVSVIETNDIAIYLQWIRHEGNLMILDLEIVNFSEETIFVNPDLFHLNSSNKPITVAESVPSNHPLSEAAIHSRYMSKIRSREGFKFLIGIASAGVAAISQVNLGRGDSNPARRVNSDIMATASIFAGDLVTTILDHDQNRLAEDLHYIQYEIFKGGSIYPDQSMRGKVYFKYPVNKKFYQFILLFEGDQYIFDFKR
jgi:hypothetical protein